MKKVGFSVWLAAAVFPFFVFAAESLLINGAGATFPYPLYSKWFYEYQKINSKVKINYQSIGSGGGIQQITAGTVDFGASDAPMSESELAKPKGKIVHIPTVIGGVVLAYNQKEVGADLKLSGELVGEIFLGLVKKWNDPKIAALNPNKKLPDKAILIVHRSDGSGTTFVFTDYLAKVSSGWKSKVGAGKSVNWPAGLGAKGNEGVTGMIKQTPGSLGYVELAYATQNKLDVACIKNKTGQFVKPTIESISASAAEAKIPSDFRISITNASGANAYPISSFTYLLIYENQKDTAKGKALVDFVHWAIHEGQKLAPALHYAPLPANMIGRIEQTMAKIKTPQQGKITLGSGQ